MGIDQETGGNFVVDEANDRSCVVCRSNGLLEAVTLTEQTAETEYHAEELEWVAEQCCEIMLEEFQRYTEKAEILVRRNFLLSLRRRIEEHMEITGVPKEACSSTILSVCVDWNRGLYCVFQLGNGIIIANGATPEPIFYPFSFRRNRTENTTISEEALLDLQFERGRLGDIQGFVLMASDRIWTEICIGQEEQERGIAILHREGHRYERKDEEADCSKPCE